MAFIMRRAIIIHRCSIRKMNMRFLIGNIWVVWWIYSVNALRCLTSFYIFLHLISFGRIIVMYQNSFIANEICIEVGSLNVKSIDKATGSKRLPCHVSAAVNVPAVIVASSCQFVKLQRKMPGLETSAFSLSVIIMESK